MKTYAVVLTIEIDEGEDWNHPRNWQFDELIGGEVTGWSVLDVTDSAVERARIDADGVEVIA
jgi:hypothetical protein